MGEAVRFQEILRRLAMIDEGFVQGEAGLGLGPIAASALDPKTVALLRVAASVAIGSSPVCLEWSTGRALTAGASEDEIADVLLAIAPVAGLGRIVSAAPRWQSRSDMTPRPRWRNQTSNDEPHPNGHRAAAGTTPGVGPGRQATRPAHIPPGRVQ